MSNSHQINVTPNLAVEMSFKEFLLDSDSGRLTQQDGTAYYSNGVREWLLINPFYEPPPKGADRINFYVGNRHD